MIFYRLAQYKYRKDLSGEGAKLYGGRWNSIGLPMVYASEHISLSVLEIMVNKRFQTENIEPFFLLTLKVPNDGIKIISKDSLKNDWFEDFDYTQYIGDQFLMDNSFGVLKVPSAVIPDEYNCIMNPNHSDFSKIELIDCRVYGIDNRLWG